MTHQQQLRLSQVAFGLRHAVLGASNHRMGVWTQGCSLDKCQGCASVHTWPDSNGTVVNPRQLVALALQQAITPTGLTISGGEPTDQADAIAQLARLFRRHVPGAEIILYTGLPWARFEKEHASLIRLLDVVVAGPYRNDLAATALSGSDNQVVELLTPLAKRLYHHWQQWPRHLQQVAVTQPQHVVAVGIPDLQRMQQVAEQTQALKVSWQRRIRVVNIQEDDA